MPIVQNTEILRVLFHLPNKLSVIVKISDINDGAAKGVNNTDTKEDLQRTTWAALPIAFSYQYRSNGACQSIRPLSDRAYQNAHSRPSRAVAEKSLP